ncbi:hypothetical protein EBZ35_08755, partial [bacterium]|nr:hypothetical protein [bacterium]
FRIPGSLLMGSESGVMEGRLTGKPGQISVTVVPTGLQLGLPQSIDPMASVQFQSVTLSKGLAIGTTITMTTSNVSFGTVLQPVAVTVIGTLNATALSGDGSRLTGITLENAGGVLPVSKGGLGIDSISPGSLLTGDQWGGLRLLGPLGPAQLVVGSALGVPTVAQLVGVPNQIAVAMVNDELRLSLPQDIDTTARPTFLGLTTSYLTVGDVITISELDQQVQVGVPGQPVTVGVTGTVSATSFSGDGSGLTQLPASQLTGVLSVAQGGTGRSSFAKGVVMADQGNAWTSLPLGAGQVVLGVRDNAMPVAGSIVAGAGVSIDLKEGFITISHQDTSSAPSVSGTGGEVIQSIALDPFGHVTGVVTANFDERYLSSTQAAQTLCCFYSFCRNKSNNATEKNCSYSRGWRQ